MDVATAASASDSSSAGFPSPAGSMDETQYWPGVPSCAVKELLLQSALNLGKSVEDLEPLARRIVVDNWLESLSDLQSLTSEEWLALNIPARLMQQLKVGKEESQLSLPPSPMCSSVASTSIPPFLPNSAEAFIRAAAAPCLADDVQAAVKVIVEDNWYETVDHIRNLSDHQWEVLSSSISPGVIRAIRHALAVDASNQSDSPASSSPSKTPLQDPPVFRAMLSEAVVSAGRSQQFADFCVERLQEHQILSASDFYHRVGAAEWKNFELPLRLFEELTKKLQQAVETTESGVQRPLRCLNGSTDDGWQNSQKPRAVGRSVSSQFDLRDPRIITEASQFKEMSAEKFLYKIGERVGRRTDEITPLVHCIVVQNWLDSLEALRSLSVEEWKALGLPKRLVDAVLVGLTDPELLEYDSVMLHAPDPSQFPCDVQTAVEKFTREVDAADLTESLRSLVRLMETLLCSPFDRTKRVIKKQNPNFQKRAGRYKAAAELLRSVGYSEMPDVYLLPCLSITRVTACHEALTLAAVRQKKT